MAQQPAARRRLTLDDAKPKAPPAKADVAEKPIAAKGEAGWSKLRKSVDARLTALETYRYSWWVHWRELAEYILPRRYRWLITPNQWNRGSPINQRILDNTPTLAARTLASGMMSGVTSPARPWFNLTVQNKALADNNDVRLWLDDTRDRIALVMSASNYYTAKAVQYLDLAIFGTAPMIIYEDLAGSAGKIIRCFNPCAGEYFCACGKNFTVNTLYRKFTMTISQVVEEYGYENCPQDIKQAWDDQNAGVDREVIVAHAIEPNPDFIQAAQGNVVSIKGVPSHFSFQEIYWVWGSSQDQALRVSGFQDQPFSCPRWDVTGNDAYGRSPAMDALGDIKQLQLEQKRKAMAIDKMVNPPMNASTSMKNEPASLNPGAVNYVSDLGGAGVGFKPVFQVTPPIQELKEDIAQVQERIKDTFFNDLFKMISDLETVRTATEIDARTQEKLILLGPVLERFNSEGLDPDIARIYNIMLRNGMLLAPPPELANAVIKPQYVSVLSDQQRATVTTSIERLFTFVGSLSGVVADAIDKLDTDVAIERYGEALRVPADVLRNGQALEAVRQQRAQQEQAQQQAQIGQAAVQGAQTLSQTDVGGGQNALQQILGQAPTAASTA